MFRFYKIIICVIGLVFALAISSCQTNSQTMSHNENIGQEILEKDKGQPCNIPSYRNKDWQELWQKFSSETNYRLATSEDFKIPEIVLQDYWFRIDMESWAKCPVKAGDFNQDGDDDYAIIAINSDIDSDDKFSLIIFNAPTNKNDEVVNTSPQWVYKDKNLSRYYLSWSRAGLSVTEIKEGGSSETCFVKWDKKNQQYSCKNQSNKN